MKNTFSILLLTFILSACTADTDDSQDIITPEQPSEAHISIISGELLDMVEGAEWQTDSLTEDILILSASFPSSGLPVKGNILIADECERLPFGFAGKIENIEKSDKIYIYTSPVSLDDLSDKFDLSSDNNMSAELIDVLDNNGNPIEYELCDSTGASEGGRSRATGFWESAIVKFPFEIADRAHLRVDGEAYLGFESFSANITKEAGQPVEAKFDITPTAGIKANSTVKLTGKAEKKIRLGQLRLRLRAAIPPGIPVIIPVTFYVYGEFGASGEISATFTLEPKFSSRYLIERNNGEWTSQKIKDRANDESPWVFSSVDINGEIYTQLRCGVLIGLYSASSGIGANIIPRYSIKAEASMSSEELFKVNPKVSSEISIGSELYCVASFFGKELGKHTAEFPSYNVWKEEMTLFPEITDFHAESDGKSSGFVSYSRGKNYFLENFSSDEGLVLLDDNDAVKSEYSPSTVGEDGTKLRKEQHITPLEPNRDYFVAPYFSIFGNTFYGEKHKITTEDIIEHRRYRFTIASCGDSYYAYRFPVGYSFILDIDVNSAEEVVAINGNSQDMSYYKTFTLQDKRVDSENGRSDVTKEYKYISIPGGYVECQNSSHTHHDDNMSLTIGYQYDQWYGYNIDGPHSRYAYIWDVSTADFRFKLAPGTYTPCSGYIEDSNTPNRRWPKIYDLKLHIERLDEQ